MAKKPTTRHTDQHRAVIKLLESFRPRHQLWRVWEDFVAAAACSLSAAVEPARKAAREKHYGEIAKRYNREELSAFAECLAYTAEALEVRHQDFLGNLYMSLDLGNKHRGQFFTPYEVCQLMARIQLAADWESEVESKGFITVMDPCIGGGAMLIAMAEMFREAQIPTSRALHVVGVDIDITAVHMAYVQLSLLYVPAVILHGNSLAASPYAGWSTDSAWRTPAHCLNHWDRRLWERDQREMSAATAEAVAESVPLVSSTSASTSNAPAATDAAQLSLLATLEQA